MISTLFKWRHIMKACPADFYGMGCIEHTEFVWPCLSKSRNRIRYKIEDFNCLEIQLWFNFITSSLPLPPSLSLI
jgi:hypothetical protein